MAKSKKVLLATAQLAVPKVPNAIYFGCDQSFTGTGLVAIGPDGQLIDYALITTDAPSTPQDEVNRFLDIFNRLHSFVKEHSRGLPVCIMLEDFAFAATNKMADIGGLGWFLRLMINQAGWYFSVVSPGTLKKCATGKGNGGKIGVVLGCFKRWQFETENDNVADARVLGHLCWTHYAKPIPDGRTVLQRDLECCAAAKTYR